MRIAVHLSLWYVFYCIQDEYETDKGYSFLCFTFWVPRKLLNRAKIKKL